jgi:hypothetical protein
MKRILLTAVSSSALALAAPGVALAAHHGKHHHHAHHAKSHARHAKHARLIVVGSSFTSSAPGSSGTPAPTTPATTPTPGETAGTVTSFKEGVLTITLTGGKELSGTVNENTEISCQPASPPAETPEGGDDGEDRGGQEGSGDNGSTGHGDSGVRPGQSGQQTDGVGDGEDGPAEQTCTKAALVPGAVVREAELSVSGSGAVWDRISLIQ